jgi:hypothetical protein
MREVAVVTHYQAVVRKACQGKVGGLIVDFIAGLKKIVVEFLCAAPSTVSLHRDLRNQE